MEFIVSNGDRVRPVRPRLVNPRHTAGATNPWVAYIPGATIVALADDPSALFVTILDALGMNHQRGGDDWSGESQRYFDAEIAGILGGLTVDGIRKARARAARTVPSVTLSKGNGSRRPLRHHELPRVDRHNGHEFRDCVGFTEAVITAYNRRSLAAWAFLRLLTHDKEGWVKINYRWLANRYFGGPERESKMRRWIKAGLEAGVFEVDIDSLQPVDLVTITASQSSRSGLAEGAHALSDDMRMPSVTHAQGLGDAQGISNVPTEGRNPELGEQVPTGAKHSAGGHASEATSRVVLDVDGQALPSWLEVKYLAKERELATAVPSLVAYFVTREFSQKLARDVTERVIDRVGGHDGFPALSAIYDRVSDRASRIADGDAERPDAPRWVLGLVDTVLEYEDDGNGGWRGAQGRVWQWTA